MKLHYAKYLLPAIATVAMLQSCDEVDSDDRYIEIPAVEVKKAVLVEDFTGQRCTNCPTAHVMIEQLQEQYGDAFIPVSIHSGEQSISITSTRNNGLATPTGEAYDAAAGVAPHGYPSMIVDYDFSHIYQGTDAVWVNAVRNALEQTTPVELSCTATYNPAASDGNPAIDITATASSTSPYTGKLQLWIIEDGIVAPQMGVNGQSGFDRTYVHNNVFRAAANGEWGQDITLNPDTDPVSVTISYPLTDTWQLTWVPANLKIVAFAYSTPGGVAQALRVPVTVE